ncbi:MAG: hypothetical protein J7J36_03135 [Thermoplasmata archaeon]|nr:hypothetical protein [Thermoplasmata archaeon]
MKKVVMAIAISAIFILAGCVEKKAEKAKTLTMNMNGFIKFTQNDTERNMDNATYTYSEKLKSLDKGDILIIEDTIKNMTYNAQYNATLVNFSSNGSARLPFKGDLKNKFQSGEKVKINLHIIEDIFTTPYQGHTWNIDVESFEELWDSQNHTQRQLLSPDIMIPI